jgi:hypothetical protein
VSSSVLMIITGGMSMFLNTQQTQNKDNRRRKEVIAHLLLLLVLNAAYPVDLFHQLHHSPSLQLPQPLLWQRNNLHLMT